MATLSGLLTGNPSSRSGQRATLTVCLVALSVGIVLAANPGRRGVPSPASDPQASATLDSHSSPSTGIAPSSFALPLPLR